jgi:hypothetical protein
MSFRFALYILLAALPLEVSCVYLSEITNSFPVDVTGGLRNPTRADMGCILLVLARGAGLPGNQDRDIIGNAF